MSSASESDMASSSSFIFRRPADFLNEAKEFIEAGEAANGP